jgi:SAM-dependent methyltransferase
MGRRALRGSVSRQVAGGRAALVPDPDLAAGWLLLVDGTQQSHVDLDEPGRLAFEYMRRIGHVIDLQPPGPLRVVHLGGGAMTLARYTAATRPRSDNLVVESDGALVDLVREHLPWPRAFRIRVRVGDARNELDRLPDASADLVVVDVFSRARTPGPLTSVEAFAEAGRVLAPTGSLIGNIADSAPLSYARAYVAGMRAVFDEVVVATEPGVLRGRRFGNLIVVGRPAAAPALDLAALTRRCASDPWPARVLHGGAVAQFVGEHRPFRDATAPGSPEPPAGFLDAD